jgi:photosystem II stability/assembly factor-like uncharacterized protein
LVKITVNSSIRRIVKTWLIISVLICLSFKQITYSQWIQTDGPYGSTSVSAIFENDDHIFTITGCGLHYAADLKDRWRIAATTDAMAYAQKGDSLFLGSRYDGVMLLDLSQPDRAPVPMGLSISINTLTASDTCLFAGTEAGGFVKSIGFTENWQSFNDGLPIDTMYIPRGGFYLVRYVYSMATINDMIFSGTRKGVYKANIENLTWAVSGNGLPEEQVHLLYASDDTLYAGIDTKIYASHDLGESWKEFHTASSRITSISDINECFYITTEGGGIFRSRDRGSSWTAFNTGLTDLNVTTITGIDSILVCGTSNKGFHYLNGDAWTKHNEGIICSQIRSITATSNGVVANDEEKVYLSGNGYSWKDISPDVTYELFGSVASMNDTVFLSVEYDTPSWPYDAPFIVFSPDLGLTWENLVNPVPFVRDDPYRLYCENGMLYAYEDEIMYHTDDLGASWTELSLPGQYCNYYYDFLIYQGVEFALACGNAELLKLDQYDNWILSNHGLPSNRDLEALAKTSDALYVYVSGTGMYVSRDYGQNWSMAGNGLDMDWWNGAYAYSDGSIFIAAENGVSYSDDHGQHWYTLNNGLINLNVRAIALHHDTLFLGTQGNGIWKHDLASIPLSIPENKTEKGPPRIYPNPASEFVYIDHTDGPSPWIQIIDLRGRQIIHKRLDANGMLFLTGIPNGTFILKLTTDREIFTTKLTIKR